MFFLYRPPHFRSQEDGKRMKSHKLPESFPGLPFSRCLKPVDLHIQNQNCPHVLCFLSQISGCFPQDGAFFSHNRCQTRWLRIWRDLSHDRMLYTEFPSRTLQLSYSQAWKSQEAHLLLLPEPDFHRSWSLRKPNTRQRHWK